MKFLFVVMVFTTLLALVVTWPNAGKPNNELSLQQLDNAMIKADGELSFYLHIIYNHPFKLRSPYKQQVIILSLMT